VKGVVVAAIDGIGPLCDVVAAETMVAWTDDGRLGDDSPVVEIVVGIEDFPKEVTTFVSIDVWGTIWHSWNWIGTINDAKISVFGVSTEPRVVVDSSRSFSGTKVCNPVASKDPCWYSFYLNGGGRGCRPRSLRDWWSLGSSTVLEYPRHAKVF
jgi:hypothetical protein